MFKISKLTDYGVVLLAVFAKKDPLLVLTARELHSETLIPLPTVGKLLRLLSQGGLLDSQRGVHGGYRLAKSPKLVSLADVLTALEGPIAITECCEEKTSNCQIESSCHLLNPWKKINSFVIQGLKGYSLSDLVESEPMKPLNFLSPVKSNEVRP